MTGTANKRPRTELKGSDSDSPSLPDVEILNVSQHIPEDPLHILMASFLPDLTLPQIGWPVPGPGSEYQLYESNKNVCYISSDVIYKDNLGSRRIAFYANSHGSNLVWRDEERALFLPYVQTQNDMVFYGNRHVICDKERMAAIHTIFQDGFKEKGTTLRILQSLGTDYLKLRNLSLEAFKELVAALGGCFSDGKVNAEMLLKLTNSDFTVTRGLANTILAQFAHKLTIADFITEYLPRLTVESIYAILATLKFQLPLDKLNENYVGQDGKGLVTVPLSEAGDDAEVITSASNLTLRSLKQVSPTLPVYLVPVGGLYQKRLAKGRKDVLSKVPCSHEKASVFKAVARKVEATKPTIVLQAPIAVEEGKTIVED